jgi:hypothetical protein
MIGRPMKHKFKKQLVYWAHAFALDYGAVGQERVP